MAAAPPVNDPLFGAEWYIKNTGQAGGGPGIDLDVVPVWADYTGTGVKVAVVDDGVQLDHPDLAANVDVADSYDSMADTLGGGAGNPVVSSDNHGTAVAGILAATGNNGIGTVGVAYGATLIAYRIPLTEEASAGTPEIPTDISAIGRAFIRQLAAGVDVSSNSWGNDNAFGTNWTVPNAESKSIEALGAKGRGGLGTPIVVAAGNARARGADAMLDNLNNSRFAITVGALNNDGTAAAYSTQGADLLVSAFGGRDDQVASTPGSAITTADRTGIAGYNAIPGTAGDSTNDMNGTSAATPMVSGVIALMLQAAPKLGYRDVQSILVQSARFNDPSSAGWTFNAAGTSNGGGLHYSRDYGFGQVDARAAVRLAETWQYVDGIAHTDANLQTATATSDAAKAAAGTVITPNAPLTVKFNVGQALVADRIEVALNLADVNPSTLVITLQSPTGTVINLVKNPGNALTISGEQSANPVVTATAWPGIFTLDTPAYMGELSQGNWSLTIADSSQTGGVGATFNDARLTVLGDAPAAAKTYVFNNDFGVIAAANPSRLSQYGQVGQVSRLDAAAVSGDVTFNLSGAAASTVQGQRLTFTPGAQFDQLLGGDGNDTLIGDGRGELFYGGRGSNVIDGGVAAAGVDAGTSTAAYLNSRAAYSVVGGPGDTYSVQPNGISGSVDQLSHIGKMQFLEGTLYAPGATDTAIRTAELYEGVLGRAPDAAGFKFWTTGGEDLAALEKDFQGSAEFQHGLGTVSDSDFVTSLYQNLLGRPADSRGLNFWTSDLQSHAESRGDLAVDFSQSAEFSANDVAHLFSAINSVGNVWGV